MTGYNPKNPDAFDQVEIPAPPPPVLNIVPAPGGSILEDGAVASPNYRKGISGWILRADGSAEFNAGIAVLSLDIPDTTTAASFHVDSSGNLWIGATTFGAAPFSVSNTGNLIATSATIAGYVVQSQGSFGGDGSDGALSITSGTTTVSIGSALKLTKNYTSISITSTGALDFSNPHAQGSIVVLKSTGTVTVTSSASSTISVKGMGGGNPATATSVYASQADSGGDPGGAGTARGAGLAFLVPAAGGVQLGCGAEGGSGGSSFFGGSGGAGGRGGGALYIECAGALDFGASASINAGGNNGSNGSNSNNGGGGGGGGGTVVILYNTLTTNAGTITATGGTGGTGQAAGGAGGAGADSGGGLANGGGGGGSNHVDYGQGGGGGGGCGGSAGSAGGTSGSTAGGGGGGGGGSWLVAKNTVLT